jgi:hypothetical protein
MVHILHTSSADTTVVATRWLSLLAPAAKSILFDGFAGVAFYEARGSQNCFGIVQSGVSPKANAEKPVQVE